MDRGPMKCQANQTQAVLALLTLPSGRGGGRLDPTWDKHYEHM